MGIKFKVLSLNCWGLAVVSKNRKCRINAIAEVLSSNQYDVVCLQEVWVDSDYHLIKQKLEPVLPYSHYFYSGVTGSGICIFSKHFITETFFHQWSVNGYIHKLHHGDWWAGKGVCLCRLQVKSGEKNYHINVYSAHLHAEYNRASDDYQAHRVLQAYDTAQFILLTSSSADLVVLAGDLNTEPGDLAYRIILTVPGLTDSYLQASGMSEDLFATCGSYINSYTDSVAVKNRIMGQRIDYVLYHPGQNVRVDFKNYSLPLPERVPAQCFSFSDHEAILVELELSRDEGKSNRNPADQIAKKLVLEESIAVCKKALRSIEHTKYLYWFGVFLMVVLLGGAIIYSNFVKDFSTIVSLSLEIIFTIGVVFCFLMATMWSRIETHGVKAGKLAMEKSLNAINTITNCD